MTPPETKDRGASRPRDHAPRGSSTGAGAVAAAARHTHDDSPPSLPPLISCPCRGVCGRGSIAQREYPFDVDTVDVQGRPRATDEPFAEVSLWLERQVPSVATDAAAAMFAAFAELLTALIGEPLTTRYMEKAWPDGFSDAQPKGKKA